MTDDWRAIDILLAIRFLHHGPEKESPRETAATYHHATLTHIDHHHSTTEGMMVFVGTNQYAGQIMIRDPIETGILGGGMNEIVLGIRDQARIMIETADHTIWTETMIGEEVSSNFGVTSHHSFFLNPDDISLRLTPSPLSLTTKATCLTTTILQRQMLA